MTEFIVIYIFIFFDEFQNERESICLELSKLTLLKTDPMYSLELRTMLENGKIVKLNQSGSFDSNIYLEVFENFSFCCLSPLPLTQTQTV